MDSGGPGSGLYRSADGGTTWKEIKEHSIPEGVKGRIGVTVSGANPNRIWARDRSRKRRDLPLRRRRRKLQFDLLIKIRDKVTQTDDTINQIRDLRDQINAINKRLKNDARAKAVADAGKSLGKKIIEVEEALIQTKAKSGQVALNFPIRLNNQLVALGGRVGSADSAPTQQSYEVFHMLSKSVDEQLAKWKTIVASEVKS
jgi:hypothetical protein